MAEIIELSDSALEDALNLAAKYPFKPYSFYDFDGTGVEKYFRSHLLDLYKSDNKFNVLIGPNNKIVGLGAWGNLHWDSNQLKQNVGRLHFLSGLHKTYEEECRTREIILKKILEDVNSLGLDYMIARFESTDHSIIHLLEKYGFITLDCFVTLFRKLADVPRKLCDSSQFNIREAIESDLGNIKKIAYSSYTFDRFHVDPAINNNFANHLHAVWTENCLMGKEADVVLCAEQKGVILGYVACKINKKIKEFLDVGIGNIVLSAISKEYRGKGIAQALIHESYQWLKNNCIDFIEVGTQIQNTKALGLYQKMGFNIVSSSLTLRRVFNNNG